MKIRYYLKKRGNGPHPVYLALYEGESVQLIFSGHRIPVKEWSVKDRAPKNHNSDITKALERLKASVNKVIKKLELEERIVSPVTVKAAFEDEQIDKRVIQSDVEQKVKADKVTVIKLADMYLEKRLSAFRPSTQIVVRSSINTFIAWLTKSRLKGLERKDLIPSIIADYEHHLFASKKSINTHGKLMKHLRWFLRYIDYDVSKIKILNSKKRIIALTLAELGRLEAVDVSASVEQQKAKDMFLLGCYTGLRISDLKRLNPVNTKDGMITIRLQKNDKEVRIPITADCRHILEKYNYRAPKIHEQKVNESIKTVCESAKINEPTVIDYTKGKQVLSKTVPKYKVITSHVSSKTFITLAPERFGMTPAEIAHVVGKDLRTLLNNYFADKGDTGRQKMIEMDRAKMKVS